MELQDYTTLQLLNELKRRFKAENPTERKAPAKPEYAIAKGTIARIANTDKAFTHWVFYVHFDETDVEAHSLPVAANGIKVSLYPGKFRKDNPPKVGDRVIIRCRITKTSPKFNLYKARIMEVINE